MRPLVALNGHPALKRWLRWIADMVPLPAGERVTVLRMGPLKGFRMPLDLGTPDRHIWFNTYEPWVQATLAQVLRPGMVVWDIGAYIGFYVALASKVAGTSVVAVEPDPDNRRRLLGTISVNSLRGVTVVASAVGREVGEARFASVGGMTGSLSAEGELWVQVTTLDELVGEYGVPGLILMDIEGAEKDALAGGAELLARFKPQLLIELHGAAGVAAASYLSDLGYSVMTQAGTPIAVQMENAHRVHALARR